VINIECGMEVRGDVREGGLGVGWWGGGGGEGGGGGGEGGRGGGGGGGERRDGGRDRGREEVMDGGSKEGWDCERVSFGWLLIHHATIYNWWKDEQKHRK